MTIIGFILRQVKGGRAELAITQMDEKSCRADGRAEMRRLFGLEFSGGKKVCVLALSSRLMRK